MNYTEQEVLNHHKSVLDGLMKAVVPSSWDAGINHQQKIDMCRATINMLEKEVAKKPVWVFREPTQAEKDFGLNFAEPEVQCPYCHKECRKTVSGDETTYIQEWEEPARCAECNQKLDWTGEKLVINEADQIRLDI